MVRPSRAVNNITDKRRAAFYNRAMSLRDEHGRVNVKFFIWPSIIISLILTIIGTILLNIII